MVQEIELNVDGLKCKIQKGFSYFQQNELITLIEEYINVSELRKIQSQLKPNETITLDQANQILKEGKKITEFNFELSKYCLLNFMIEPKITEANLRDPDDPHSDNYAILGLKLSELALAHISKKTLLKKTPTE